MRGGEVLAEDVGPSARSASPRARRSVLPGWLRWSSSSTEEPRSARSGRSSHAARHASAATRAAATRTLMARRRRGARARRCAAGIELRFEPLGFGAESKEQVVEPLLTEHPDPHLDAPAVELTELVDAVVVGQEVAEPLRHPHGDVSQKVVDRHPVGHVDVFRRMEARELGHLGIQHAIDPEVLDRVASQLLARHIPRAELAKHLVGLDDAVAHRGCGLRVGEAERCLLLDAVADNLEERRLRDEDDEVAAQGLQLVERGVERRIGLRRRALHDEPGEHEPLCSRGARRK